MTGPANEAQRRGVRQLLRIAPVADELGSRFSAAGHDIALVGGSVRDAMLDRLGNDLDLATSAHPAQTKRLLSGWADSVWDVGAAFGTIGATKNGFHIEVTTYRADAYDPASRKPEVSYGESIYEDLVRRDFTINAMAVKLPSREFVDPHDGLTDLARRVIQTPSTPESSFSDDPLRMLRAARFAAQLGFEVSPEVVTAMTNMADRIGIVSAERIRDELVKLILSDRPRPGLTLLVDTGLADLVLPELPALRMEIDEHHRHKNVYEHSLTVLDQAIELEDRLPDGGPDLVTRLAAAHDIGKPRTRRFEPGGGVSFHHHDVVGAKMTRKRLSALRFPGGVVDDVSALVGLHLRFHGYGSGEWTDSAIRRYVRDAGHLLERLHVLTRGLHDPQPAQGPRAASLVRQPGGADRATVRAGGARRDPARPRRSPDHEDPRYCAGTAGRPGVSASVGAAPRSWPAATDIARDELLRWWADQPENAAR